MEPMKFEFHHCIECSSPLNWFLILAGVGVLLYALAKLSGNAREWYDEFKKKGDDK